MNKDYKNIVLLSNPLIREKSGELVFDLSAVEAPKVLSELHEKMVAEMMRTQGIGISAIQVGSPVAVFIALLPDRGITTFVNPKIVAVSDEKQVDVEGCLSIPNSYANVARHKSVTVSYYEYNHYFLFSSSDKALVHKTETFTDLAARIIQHEMDHCEGKLFIDHLSRHDRRAVESQFKKFKVKSK